jgi:16S rRNA (adenine1518-N6/adenine1519-N6)-dimethyltransferase
MKSKRRRPQPDDLPKAPPPPRRMSKISRVLTQHGLRPDKRFGQNFLVNQGALESIARASGAGPRSAVVEIGAGLGNLTELLGKAAGAVSSVELDENFRGIHQTHFGDAGNIRFVYGDILGLSLADVFPPGDWDERIVVGNIPYNITSRIVIKLLEEIESLDRAYILMQKEVAERLRAKPGNRTYSVLTVKMRCGFDINIKTRITGRSFLPPPKVDSALVEFIPAKEQLVPDRAERAEFFAMLDGAFSQRRKVLPNSLSHATSGAWARADIAAILTEMNHDPAIRPEALDSAQFLAIYRALRDRLGAAAFAHRRS